MYRIRLNPAVVMKSQRDLRVMGKRPTKPQSQRLERHRTQGERYLRLPAYWLTVFVTHPDRPSPSARGQVDSRIFLEDAGHMDCDA